MDSLTTSYESRLAQDIQDMPLPAESWECDGAICALTSGRTRGDALNSLPLNPNPKP